MKLNTYEMINMDRHDDRQREKRSTARGGLFVIDRSIHNTTKEGTSLEIDEIEYIGNDPHHKGG